MIRLRKFDTLFSRMAFVAVLATLITHMAAIPLVARSRNSIEEDHTLRVIALIVRAHGQNIAAAVELAADLGAWFLDEPDADCPCEQTGGGLEARLKPILPEGTIVAHDAFGTLRVRLPGESRWLVLPDATISIATITGILGSTVIVTLVFSALAGWSAGHPLRRLITAAQELRSGRRPQLICEKGPQEVRELTATFNEAVQALEAKEQDRTLVSAGFAHDLRNLITRNQFLAEMHPEDRVRDAMQQNASAMGRMVSQFLDFACEDTEDHTDWTSVDAFCLRNYGEFSENKESPGQPLFFLTLQAGTAFQLPLETLERILLNLVDNALTYGESPVEIDTFRLNEHFVLSVTDHGRGIPAHLLERALRPFSRLGAERADPGHSGLGLAIVRRLVCMQHGWFRADNSSTGGFRVQMGFPLKAPIAAPACHP